MYEESSGCTVVLNCLCFWSPMFCMCAQIIGSSLLFVAQHNTNTCGVWVIDFGKTTKLPEGQRLNHNTTWVEGNREDGYLWGLNNLIDIWSRLFDEEPELPACNDNGNAVAVATASHGVANTPPP